MRVAAFAAFETSTEWCSVALWRAGGISAIEIRAPNRHGELALPMLERLLAAAGLRACDLDAVAFGSGPGSFTGLRIACALAQGLAYANDLPVLGVSTLEALAEESAASKVVACVDARMHEVYYAALLRDENASGGNAWREIIGPQCLAPGAAPVPDGTGWIGCGSGFTAYRTALEGALRGILHGIDVDARPSAVAVARLAAPRLAAGEGCDASQAMPVYVRDKVAMTSLERSRA